ncbi:MAG: lamin tail domain-containing protein, partial [Candidatus Eisenbacteria bacterium]|nr:lamin tail domain-containing protein [Candidatus Eisenbacteria bacterium]
MRHSPLFLELLLLLTVAMPASSRAARGGALIEPGDVVINEFAASNTVILDPAGEAEDWIEMYNNTSEAVSLDGMYLTDTPANPGLWQFPTGTTIEAEGFLIVWADQDLEQEGLHAGFKLSASGEQIWFSDVTLALLDSVTFGPQTTNLTMARVPNGTGPFVQGTPTFNATNGGGGGNVIDPGAVVINEFVADNDTLQDPAGETDDWIELYNTTNQPIDLGGLYMSDDFAEPTKWQIPDGTTIGVDGYLMVWADEDLTQEGLHAAFKLSASGEAIVLSNTDLSIVDSTSFVAQVTNVSMARIPNGTGAFVPDTTPTPGINNEDEILQAMVLSIELVSAGTARMVWPAVTLATDYDIYRGTTAYFDTSGA